MMELILDTRTYDPGYLYYANYEGQISNMISSGSNSVTKFAERYAATAAESVATLIESMTTANS